MKNPWSFRVMAQNFQLSYFGSGWHVIRLLIVYHNHLAERWPNQCFSIPEFMGFNPTACMDDRSCWESTLSSRSRSHWPSSGKTVDLSTPNKTEPNKYSFYKLKDNFFHGKLGNIGVFMPLYTFMPLRIVLQDIKEPLLKLSHSLMGTWFFLSSIRYFNKLIIACLPLACARHVRQFSDFYM